MKTTLPVARADGQAVAVVGEVDHPLARTGLLLTPQVGQPGCRPSMCTLVGHVADPVAAARLVDRPRCRPRRPGRSGASRWCWMISLDTTPEGTAAGQSTVSLLVSAYLRDPERLPSSCSLAAERVSCRVRPGVSCAARVVRGARRPSCRRRCRSSLQQVEQLPDVLLLAVVDHSSRGTATASARPYRCSPASCG